jgi:branched-chain amino acid transport system ATP-binding protein
VSLLVVEQAVGGYGDSDILNGVDLAVAAGEIAVIIGPNGAGKSTAMKAIAGLVRVRRGTIRFDGAVIANQAPERIVRRGLAYVPQERNVFPNLSVAENLELGGFLRRDAGDALTQIYDLFPPLKEKRRDLAGALSGGQRQMVAIGRALMMAPRLLMLDEPTAGLSPRFMDQIFAKIAEINRAGTAVLMVEQNARHALALAHRGYVLQMGRNRFSDTGPALLANPEVVQMFLGG